MQHKSIITLATAALLGFAVLVPQAALAQMRFSGAQGTFASTHFAHSPNVSPVAFHNRFAFRDRFAFHNRLAFHHRFLAFRHPFAFAAAVADDGCFRVHRVWTSWGWRWRRIWVCG
jgi:hypothetical protein